MDGEAKATVVIPDDAHPIARYAAEELIYHIQLATGATLPLVKESEAQALPEEKARIFVGAIDPERFPVTPPPASLKPEQTRLTSNGRDWFIYGNDTAGNPLDFEFNGTGTLWGVYEVIQRTLDARWIWPGEDGIVLKKTDRLVPPKVDETFAPPFVSRILRPGTKWENGKLVSRHPDIDHALEVGLGFSSHKAKEAYFHAQQVFLRRLRMGRTHPFDLSVGHTFSSWWSIYGKKHPEWFQLIPDMAEATQELSPRERVVMVRNRITEVYGQPEGTTWKGRRGPIDPRTPSVSMNVAHPEMHAEVLRRWQEKKVANPGVALPLELGEADTHCFDLSPEAIALDAPQPTREEIRRLPGSAPVHHIPFDAGRRYAWFYREMHKKASAIDPDVIVTGYVYANYLIAPKDLKLNPNIILTFVPWSGWYYPRSEAAQEWLRDQWMQWRATGARLLFRPNFTLTGGPMPINYVHQMGREFEFFTEQGCIGVDYDSLLGQWGTQASMLYVLAGQTSRPGTKTEALLEEFYSAFGPAAPAVKAYFDYWERYTNENGRYWDAAFDQFEAHHYLRYSRAAHALFPVRAFEKAEPMLEEAATLARESSDPIHARRVEFIRLGMVHARKCSELSRVFAQADSSNAMKKAALEDLASFRRQTEDRYIANFGLTGADEFRSYSGEYDFGRKTKTESHAVDDAFEAVAPNQP